MRKISNATKLLLALSDITEVTANHLDAFLFSARSATRLRRKLRMLDKEYTSSFQGLCRHGYIKRINENQFLITPKALGKVRIAKIEASGWEENVWDGYWKIISFDIPETKKKERNIFRSLIKHKGFIGVQNSFFVSPYADFEDLAELREDLKIEKYVSFFLARSYKTDDDTNLKKKFNLK